MFIDYRCKHCGLENGAMIVGTVNGVRNRIVGCYSCIILENKPPIDHGPNTRISDGSESPTSDC